MASSELKFSPEQKKTLREVICKGATDEEFNLFLVICERTGLDPFSRQIHFVRRYDAATQREVGAAHTGIDGYRLIAQRTGEYDGQGPKEWCGEDGAWTEVWLAGTPPVAARATVYRKGIQRPFTAIARYAAYVQRRRQDGAPNAMWSRMGAEQLAKCAEALSLRMAFPNELSHLYTEDEFPALASSADEDRRAPATGTALTKQLIGAGTDPARSVAEAEADRIAKAEAERIDAAAIAEPVPIDGMPVPGAGAGEELALGAANPMCSDCEREATKIIKGKWYCDDHGPKSQPRK